MIRGQNGTANYNVWSIRELIPGDERLRFFDFSMYVAFCVALANRIASITINRIMTAHFTVMMEDIFAYCIFSH